MALERLGLLHGMVGILCVAGCAATTEQPAASNLVASESVRIASSEAASDTEQAAASDDVVMTADAGSRVEESGDAADQNGDKDEIVVMGDKRDRDAIVCKKNKRNRTGTRLKRNNGGADDEVCMTEAQWELYKQRRENDLNRWDDWATRQRQY